MIYLVILFAVLIRFIPHLNNFAPITALAIFSAAYLPKKQAIVIPLAVRFVSDIFLGFFSWPLMVAVYLSHLVGVVFGLWIKSASSVIPTELVVLEGEWRNPLSLKDYKKIRDPSTPLRFARDDKNRHWFKIIISSLGASAIFFIVTNFAFLFAEYPHTWQGIMQSYINGLPFLRGTILGDLSYTASLFGAYELAKYFIRLKKHKEQLV